jgi:hypothetical protein
LFDNDKLIAKTKANFEESTSAIVSFDLSNSSFQKARLEIEPDGLSYDNKLYFSLNKEKQINIVSLHSESSTYKSFLASIYQTDLFNFKEYSISNFDYSTISEANLIILNEVEDINSILISQLRAFKDNAGSIVIIPSESTISSTFGELTDAKAIYGDSRTVKREVTNINFEHPLFENVFSEKIQNFDYPSTSKFLDINPDFTPILKFSNGQSFLAENNRLYSFASALNSNISNFTNSPLVVPVFYNIAIKSSPTPQLYSTLGKENLINVKANLKKDEVLKLKNVEKQVIPQQSRIGNAIQINTQYQPETAGHFELVHGDSVLLNLSFNFDRSESHLKPMDLSSLETQSFSSITEAFNSFTEDRKILELWTWMLIFAAGFFLIELLILRFLN